MSKPFDWSIAIAGECMVTRPFSMHTEKEFLGIRELFAGSDVAYAHLEMNFGDHRHLHPGRGDWYGSYMLAETRLAEELRWLGVDVMSTANNHSLDFGEMGLRSTLESCRAAGLACAGTGEDLDDARAPVYVETPRGRMALISTSSGNRPHEWAGRPKETMVGRPGVNSLRTEWTYHVPAEAAARLRESAEGLGILRTSAQCGPGKTGRVLADDEFQYTLPGGQSASGELVFKESDRYRIETRCHAGDLEGNLRSIRSAAAMADVVMVAHHFNISEGPRGDRPPAFVREFAHRAIEEGADVFVGHGWHKTLGIEIYQGKPIFYGLGNFFAQSEFLEHVPSDSYETWGHDVDRLPTLTPDMWPLHPGLDGPSETWWSSAIIKVHLSEGRLTDITLHPVEMGREVTKAAKITRGTGKSAQHTLTEGRPIMADQVNGERVIERFRELSADYGTTVEVADGVGRVRVEG
ncbi:CapA family protein [Actinomadura sp. LD22]|uniref:CapA family protein n=1 Tax=Actinomadura physcomitrii TaxID=2650748 RepID=A0A6I4MJM2_9ACTN|nr:CapA family protein [Actinomadura physcomitrii]MWA04775.1 CapA family protein [Actinomadura physcomitrii]